MRGAFRRVGVGMVAVAGVLAVGCAHQLPMDPASAEVTSASGKVLVEDKRPGVRVVRVRLRDVPRPDGKRAYVVWAMMPGRAENLGSLRFRDENEAALDAVAPTEEFSIFVTAESNADASIPSAERLFVTGTAERAQ